MLSQIHHRAPLQQTIILSLLCYAILCSSQSYTASTSPEAPQSFQERVLSYIQESAQKAEIATSSWPLLAKITSCEIDRKWSPESLNINPAHYNKVGKFIGTTTDFSPLQVNSGWQPVMENLGLHYDDWKDTTDFAIGYLFKKYGVAPWYSSAHCWATTTKLY